MSKSKWDKIDWDDEDAVNEFQEEHYRIKQHNERKSLIPLFVYLIVQSESGDHRLRQKEILDLLWKKYEMKVSRGTLARVLHTLETAGLGVEWDSYGVWYAGE